MNKKIVLLTIVLLFLVQVYADEDSPEDINSQLDEEVFDALTSVSNCIPPLESIYGQGFLSKDQVLELDSLLLIARNQYMENSPEYSYGENTGVYDSNALNIENEVDYSDYRTRQNLLFNLDLLMSRFPYPERASTNFHSQINAYNTYIKETNLGHQVVSTSSSGFRSSNQRPVPSDKKALLTEILDGITYEEIAELFKHRYYVLEYHYSVSLGLYGRNSERLPCSEFFPTDYTSFYPEYPFMLIENIDDELKKAEYYTDLIKMSFSRLAGINDISEPLIDYSVKMHLAIILKAMSKLDEQYQNGIIDKRTLIYYRSLSAKATFLGLRILDEHKEFRNDLYESEPRRGIFRDETFNGIIETFFSVINNRGSSIVVANKIFERLETDFENFNSVLDRFEDLTNNIELKAISRMLRNFPKTFPYEWDLDTGGPYYIINDEGVNEKTYPLVTAFYYDYYKNLMIRFSPLARDIALPDGTYSDGESASVAPLIVYSYSSGTIQDGELSKKILATSQEDKQRLRLALKEHLKLYIGNEFQLKRVTGQLESLDLPSFASVNQLGYISANAHLDHFREFSELIDNINRDFGFDITLEELGHEEAQEILESEGAISSEDW